MTDRLPYAPDEFHKTAAGVHSDSAAFYLGNFDLISSFPGLPYIQQKADSAENRKINGVKKTDFNG